MASHTHEPRDVPRCGALSLLPNPLQYKTFWYFSLTIQNTKTSQARSLFRVAGVFILFCPWRALLLLWQLRIFAAAAARPDTTPPPFFREGSTKKNKIACSVGVGGWACWRVRRRDGGGVCYKLAAMCGSVQLCELSLKGTQSLADRPRTAWFLLFLLAFASSSFSLSFSLSPSS